MPGRVGMDDMTPEELALHCCPMTLAETQQAALTVSICSEADYNEIAPQARHWPAILEARLKLGRPLGAADLRSIVDAGRGPNDHD